MVKTTTILCVYTIHKKKEEEEDDAETDLFCQLKNQSFPCSPFIPLCPNYRYRNYNDQWNIPHLILYLPLILYDQLSVKQGGTKATSLPPMDRHT